jgi:ribosomal protein S27AE
MAYSEFHAARVVLDLPTCAKCGSPMWLSRIEPDAPDHDRRTFECPRCENEVTEIFKYR